MAGAGQKKSTTVLVLEAVQDLHNQEQVVTREVLAQVTGLKLSVVDDRLGDLVDRGAVLRVQRGVFVPAPVHPPARVVSKTLLPDGMVRLEVGEQVLVLTPREDRMLANLMGGSAVQLAQVGAGHSVATMAADLHQLTTQLGRVLARSGAVDPL